MKLIKEMSLGELAAFVCTHLQENGINCVLNTILDGENIFYSPALLTIIV